MTAICFEAEKNYRLAYDYLHYEGSLKLAKKFVSAALKCSASHSKSLVLMGQIKLTENKIKDALKFLNKAYKCNPKNSKCLALLASCHHTLQEYNLAYDFLSVAIENLSNEDEEFKSDCYKLKSDLLTKLKICKKIKFNANISGSRLKNSYFKDADKNFIADKTKSVRASQKRILYIFQ